MVEGSDGEEVLFQLHDVLLVHHHGLECIHSAGVDLRAFIDEAIGALADLLTYLVLLFQQ